MRYAGEAVAVAAAESRYLAEDALALVEVEYAPLPAVADRARPAMAEGAALVHENLGSNVVYQHAFTFGDVDADFAARRPRRPPRRCAGRASPRAPMETNGAVVRFDPASGRMDVWSNTNLLNFGAWVHVRARSASPPQHARLPPDVRWAAAFGSKHFLAKADRASRARWPRSPAGP